MRMAWRLFVGDMKRIFSNTITVIIVMGLVLLPSIFSWYNVLACWDVFDNTGNLKVAIVNNDDGYESDLVPLRVNMGEQVVTTLHENDQMNWVFTNEDDAIDGTESGKYYAAVIIPESFSKDMMTFYSGNAEHAKLIYYSNEKKNVVAPKLTDQGASKASVTVNEVFSETLAEIGLNVASSLMDYTDDADMTGQLGQLADHVDTLGTQMSDASAMLITYAQVLEASESLITGSASLLEQVGDSAGSIMDSVDDAADSVTEMGEAVSSSSDALDTAITKTAAACDGLTEKIDAALDSSDKLASQSIEDLEHQVTALRQTADDLETMAASIRSFADKIPDSDTSGAKEQLQNLASGLETSAQNLDELADDLEQVVADMKANQTTDEETRQEIKDLAERTQQSFSDLSNEYNNTIKPQLDTLISQSKSMASALSDSGATLSSIGDGIGGDADSLAANIENSRKSLVDTANDLQASSEKLAELSAAMKSALQSGDMDQLRAVLSSDTDALATALSAPVQLERNAVFPADNFGSQMAPLYTTLGLWVGSLLLAVAIKVNVSRKVQMELGYPKLRHLFLGRFGVFAVISLMQTTVLALGNLLFLQVQAAEPLLYMLCYWVSGLVFTFIIYTLVVSFANLGKAVAVFLLIIQVTAGGGSFPLQILPDFFQVLSPFLPATHMINAMRAAMMGVYEFDFWIEMGELLLFVVPFLLLGLVFRKPLMRFLNWYIEKVEESKLVC